jgi:hypothetical protein
MLGKPGVIWIMKEKSVDIGFEIFLLGNDILKKKKNLLSVGS